jgi:PPOX class probable F420-dependent enzyme
MPLSDDERNAFLAERRYATLATLDSDGVIHLTPLWFLFDGERFLFESFSDSRKVKNIERNPSTSVVVDARDPGHERWVAASGTAELITGDEAQELNARIRRRYLTEEAFADARVEPVFAAGDDVTISLTTTRWRSWTASELDQQYFGGILGETPDRWFLPVDR